MKLIHTFFIALFSLHTVATVMAQERPHLPYPKRDTGSTVSSLEYPTARLVTLPETIIRAFDLNRDLQTSPASIGIVSNQLLRHYGNTGILAAMNTIPGVRMEERSPGSYRLAVRGSSLRAPFGVRNVKIYYNGIPFTDPGGHTYLNELGFYNISRIEIIKGPGSSLYGAGTGGVALMESMPANMQRGFGIEATAGAYGLIHLEGEARSVDSTGGLRNIARYQHLTSDGYREHSAFRRDVLSWDAAIDLSAATSVHADFLYTDLRYETPGALTLAEYKANPQSARPDAGVVPGSIAANAAIMQKAFLVGAGLEHAFSHYWSYTTTLYGAFTSLENPTLRNYGRNNEPHAGGRAILRYKRPIVSGYRSGRHNMGEQSGPTVASGSFEWLIGAEAQQGLAGVQVYSTNRGSPDTLQTDDKLHIRSAMAFTQAAIEWRRWLLTAGVSINNFRVRYARLTNRPYTETIRDFNNEAAPRFALRYNISSLASAYVSVARGFSPPTSAELSPSGSSLNNALQAEYGRNYEGGIRGTLFNQDFSYDIGGYYFSLANTIVQRRDAAGGDYFINSGSTRQIGAEASLRYRIADRSKSKVGDLSAFAGYTWQHFRYKDFRQVDADFSGNFLPGVAPNTLACGIDWDSRIGLYARLSYYASEGLPLNDANDVSLDDYHLFGARIGYNIPRKGRYGIEVFAGGDNLTDITYSAGPDINGFGGRYYNAGPGRSFYAGLTLQLAH